MWIDKYQPKNFEQLIKGVHKKKAQEIQKWIKDACTDLEKSGCSRRGTAASLSPRLLILHGPSGTGKSSAVRALAGERNIALREWVGRHADGDLGWNEAQRLRDQSYRSGRGRDDALLYSRSHKLSEMDDFKDFLFRNQRYRGLTFAQAKSSDAGNTSGEDEQSNSDGDDFKPPETTCKYKQSQNSGRSLMIIEHLPSLYGGRGGSSTRRNPEKCAKFHNILLEYIRVPSNSAMPAVIIYSGDGDQPPTPADLSAVFSDEVLKSSRTVILKTNPVALTSLKRVLKGIGIAEGYSQSALVPHIEAISDSCLGDLRHAVMSLQFSLNGSGAGQGESSRLTLRKKRKAASRASKKSSMKKSKTSKLLNGSNDVDRNILGCGRDETFSMLHSLGKILRCKRVAKLDNGAKGGEESKKIAGGSKVLQKSSKRRLSGIAGMMMSPSPSPPKKSHPKNAFAKDSVDRRMAERMRKLKEQYDLSSSSSESESDLLNEFSDRKGNMKTDRVVDLISDSDGIDDIDEIDDPGVGLTAKTIKPVKEMDHGRRDNDILWDEFDVECFPSMPSKVKDSGPEARPPLAFSPEDIVESTGIHVSSVLDFISHNGPEFFSEIEELDQAFETLSAADLIMSGGYKSGFGSGSQMWHKDFKHNLRSGVATSLVGRAVADANKHPSARCRQFKPVKRSLATSILRARDANLETIRHTLWSSMSKSIGFSSPTLLEASAAVSRGVVTTVLPLAAAVLLRPSSTEQKLRNPELESLLGQMTKYSGNGAYSTVTLNVGERNQDGTIQGTWKITPRWKKQEHAGASSKKRSADVSELAAKDDEIMSW